MQKKMREHPLSEKDKQKLLDTAEVGRLGTINADGSPYVIALHFVYEVSHIYLHCLPVGQKTDNIQKDSRVCFEIDSMLVIKRENLQTPCHASTAYQSIVISGSASMVTDVAEKRRVPGLFAGKYVPEMNPDDMPQSRIKSTAIIDIAIKEITGKYHD